MRHFQNMTVASPCFTLIVMFAVLLMPVSLWAGNSLNLNSLPDPTRPAGNPAGAGQPAHTPLVLQSILHSGQRRSAIINGQVKTIGTWINGSQIRDIRQDSVVIARNGRLHVLHMPAIVDIKSEVREQ